LLGIPSTRRIEPAPVASRRDTPMSWRGADSRDYIIPFSIFREADFPSDFTLPPGMPREFAGIFLPQDRAAFSLRSFPPCVIILADATIWIVTRRSVEHTAIPLARLEVLECGRILLLGWIGLLWDRGSQTVRYNRRSAPIVEKFLCTLKMSWLRSAFTSPIQSSQIFGPEPNLKFHNAASTELLADEARLLQFFQPPICSTRRRFGLRRETRKAADLLVLSDRRLLWMTDRRQSAQEQYGTVGKSAALRALKEVRANRSAGGVTIDIGLRSGTLWSVPVSEAWEDEAKAFAEMVGHAAHAVSYSVEAGRI